MPEIAIAEWRPRDSSTERVARDLDNLAEVLHASVHLGASVGFIMPFSIDDALAFWRDKILPGAESGARRVLLARDGDRVVGTVQLIVDTMPNQRHRAEVAKMLVHPDMRRRGIGRKLMLSAEEIARADQRTLLTLDTGVNNSARTLYRSLGFVEVGEIPRYAANALTPELEGTMIMYKEL
jgi:ribosomal protein S18 acetylase RimI-like enzyme